MSATPTTRHSQHPSSARNRRQQREPTTDNSDELQLPPYEPPIAPLNPTFQHALTSLVKATHLKDLQTHIQHAAEKLHDSAGEVNERLTDARERRSKYLSRKRNRGEFEDGQDEQVKRFQQTEEEGKDISGKLEEKMRHIVDAEVKVDGLAGILMDLGQQAAAAPSTTRPRNTRRRQNRENESSDEDDNDEDEPQPEATPYSEILTQKLTADHTNWDNKLTLAQRYSTNNTYIGFYRIVHDAQHPGNDIPPLPHASTWFRHLEGTPPPRPPPTGRPSSLTNSPNTTTNTHAHPNAGIGRGRDRTTRHSSHPNATDNEEDDLAIATERISLKCPLTLLTFQEPLSSTKCPHSFERQAILDMISSSSTMVPAPGSADGGGGAGRARKIPRVRAVKCPVCEVLLTAQDLNRDPVLLRRVRRMEVLERQRQEEEEEEEEEDVKYEDDDDEDGRSRRKRNKGLRQSGITVASDEDDDDDSEEDEEGGSEDDEEEERPVQIKRENDDATPSTASSTADEE